LLLGNLPEIVIVWDNAGYVRLANWSRLAGARNVQLIAMTNCSTHLLVVELIKRGAFAPLLRWLAEGSAEALAGGQEALSQ
jgi:hypothetical protein